MFFNAAFWSIVPWFCWWPSASCANVEFGFCPATPATVGPRPSVPASPASPRFTSSCCFAAAAAARACASSRPPAWVICASAADTGSASGDGGGDAAVPGCCCCCDVATGGFGVVVPGSVVPGFNIPYPVFGATVAATVFGVVVPGLRAPYALFGASAAARLDEPPAAPVDPADGSPDSDVSFRCGVSPNPEPVP